LIHLKRLCFEWGPDRRRPGPPLLVV
jgi:hypothetical protein